MRWSIHLKLSAFILIWLLIGACVDTVELNLRGTVDVLVVDGTITNLAEPQIIRLNRSKADPYTGRFGDTPLTGVLLSVVVNGTETVLASEISSGTYQLPDNFRGQIDSQYRLRFQLPDGTHYESSDETMLAAPPINNLTDQYNPRGAGADRRDGLLATNDLYIETDDPANTVNYYRWDWKLWERQGWCHTCTNGLYYEYDGTGKLIETCIPFPAAPQITINNDYECRSPCWEILYSNQLNLFSDASTNGRTIRGRLVAQIPFY